MAVIAVLILLNYPFDFWKSDSSSTEEVEALTNETSYEVNGVTLDMINVEGGDFQMGSNDDDSEKPVHNETVATFKIGKTEVTQALWKAVMNNNPSVFKGDSLPVESVSWNECQLFISKLNSITGERFRLPTEAEWEYAARGGNKSLGYQYSGGNNIYEVAWCKDNSDEKTHPVATKLPNELGLYDMSGNVYEWTSDPWSENYNSSKDTEQRVFRGGCWFDTSNYARVSSRTAELTSFTFAPIAGLRLAL
jgi:formylglycine-generating enzyme required for sulfatase activity